MLKPWSDRMSNYPAGKVGERVCDTRIVLKWVSHATIGWFTWTILCLSNVWPVPLSKTSELCFLLSLFEAHNSHVWMYKFGFELRHLWLRGLIIFPPFSVWCQWEAHEVVEAVIFVPVCILCSALIDTSAGYMLNQNCLCICFVHLAASAPPQHTHTHSLLKYWYHQITANHLQCLWSVFTLFFLCQPHWLTQCDDYGD